jgi:CRISPR type III-B/RAMP module RAMP protein Cmr6
MTTDVAALIGDSAEKVENRSLLLEKFSFHKLWPVTEDDRGLVKWDEASRWSFIRIADGAASLLRRDADEKRRRSNGANVEPQKRDRLLREVKIADTLSAVSWDKPELATLRANHTRRFLGLFQAAGQNRSRALIAKLEGRLAINLADSLIRNAGIALDRLFGMPYVPGSAVKGVARATALEEIMAAEGEKRAQLFDLFCRVFGTADNDYKPQEELASFRELLADRPANLRGGVAFLPAYPIAEAKIVVDLTNVHYPIYYQGEKKRRIAPGLSSSLALENPQPNPFPCVEAGARFAFCLVLAGRDDAPDLLAAAERWLSQALTVRGIGAKTAAGYGWFSIEPPAALAALLAEETRIREQEAHAARKVAEDAAVAAAEAARIKEMSPEDRHLETLCLLPDQDFATKAATVGTLLPEEQRALLRALNTPAKRDRWKKWKKSDKDTDKKRVAALLAASNAHKIPLQ